LIFLGEGDYLRFWSLYMEAGGRGNMPQQRNVTVLLILVSLLAACSKGLPPSVMPAVMKADSKDLTFQILGFGEYLCTFLTDTP
jgi:hypothetical protein